jgi:uncharacterized protein involved in exopolysaccharide biosynthesis
VLEVELAEESEAVFEFLKSLPFVSKVQRENKTLIIELETTDDVRPQISQAITKAGGIIVYMNMRKRGLEEAFMRLITKS